MKAITRAGPLHLARLLRDIYPDRVEQYAAGARPILIPADRDMAVSTERTAPLPETPQEEYAAELTEILELRGLPAAAATQIGHAAQSHIADSGEDPTAVFGTPSEYADNFAHRRTARLWTLTIASVILATGGGYVLISGFYGLQSPAHELWGLTPWTRVAIGAGGIASFITLVLTTGAHAKHRSHRWPL